ETMNILRKVQPPALLVAGLALLAGSPAHATDCSDVTTGLGVPHVAVSTAALNGAGACVVLGTVKTTGFGAPDGLAKFQLTLPPAAAWNKKFVQFGQGGFAGGLSAATNAGDRLKAGNYAQAITDTGHTAGTTDASWALVSPGKPDRARLTDYYFRAVHEVAVAMKELVGRFYGTSLQRAYFDGCSNGGRQAFVEATKFPDDFDGIVAGAPFFDIRTILGGVKIQKVQLASPSAYIPASKLPAVDKAVYDSCDKVDGVADGLIQNPAKCSFDPNSLVPSVLNQDQANTLKSYFTALRDDDGRLLYTGATVTDLSSIANPAAPNGMDAWTTGFVPPFLPGTSASEPWDPNGFGASPISWQFVDHFIKDVVERDPGFDMLDYDVSTSGRVGDAALRLFDKRSEAGDGDVPEKLLPFIEKGKKLLIYHGMSDPALTATRTIKYYEDLAETAEMSFPELQEHVRLFLVPGMQHCALGPGPNVFDTLTALDQWVDDDVKPDGIIAAHFVGNNPTAGVDRTMPLCKFPEQARWNGGPVDLATSWSCPADDRGMLEVGANGRTAGLGGRDHFRDRDD
ncbi:MAG TPA: tannase/feruloyl esterase family alpha/beta hydrolase, partial [Stellaceae bacterium]